MAFPNIRPLHILWQHVLTVGMLDGITEGVKTILSLAGVANEIKVEYLGKRHQPHWLDQDGKLLNQYDDLDWYIIWARNKSKEKGHLNSTALLNSLRDKPVRTEVNSMYELVVVNEPLHWHDTSTRKVGGIGRKGQGAIITTHSYLHFLVMNIGESEKDRKKRRSEFILATKMLTIHELGHVFGLFPGTGKEDPTDEELKESHCQDDCVMYWKLDAELNKKIEGRPFCPSCLEKLKDYFLEPPTIIIDVDDSL